MPSSFTNNLIWLANNNQNQFSPALTSQSYKLDWVERINNEICFSFKFLKYDTVNGLFIFDQTRGIYIQINNNELKSGNSLDNLHLLYYGNWENIDKNVKMYVII